MHILLLPSWYPETPDSLDGIFFRQQAHALARAGLRVGVAAPLFRSPRRWREIFTGRYGENIFSETSSPRLCSERVPAGTACLCFRRTPKTACVALGRHILRQIRHSGIRPLWQGVALHARGFGFAAVVWALEKRQAV